MYAIFQDGDGVLWFGTNNGLTRYRPPAPLPPPVLIDAVVGDRRYEGVAEVEVPSVVRLTAFEFHGRSLKTRPEQMVYRYRLKGYEEAWRNTRERRVEYEDLSVSDYTFEVVAVDRDLVYSEKPATVRLRVVRDARDAQIDELERRVRERTQALQEANGALSSANRELFTLNRALQQTLEEKDRAQRQLIQAERMAAVGELVAGSAHELNNPMAVASSLVQSIGEMLKEDTPEELTEDRALMVENVRIALKDLNRAKEIVANLLSLSDRNRDYTEAVKINIVADDALRLLRGTYDREKVRVVKAYGEDLPTVTGNFADLGQMGMHLVRNAVEALKGGGTITLRTAVEGDQVVLECHDTGVGIPPEIRGEIFKPFFKTKPPAEGTGLGLYIVHRIVEKHGGTIEVESAPGKGTTFSVRLPLTR